jgi:hypothetical protein
MPGFHSVSVLQSTVQVMPPFSLDVGLASDVWDIGRFSIFGVKYGYLDGLGDIQDSRNAGSTVYHEEDSF